MDNFSTNSLALVLSSTYYDNEDYVRDFDFFLSGNIEKQTSKLQEGNNAPILDTLSLLNSRVTDCEIINLPINHRDKGNITVVQNNREIPFSIKRVYYLYDVPGGESRGGHAHKELYQLVIAAGGSFDVILNDGTSQKTVTLNRPYQALKIVPGIWRELVNFSSGATCLVMASETYLESDYIRDFENYLKCKK